MIWIQICVTVLTLAVLFVVMFAAFCYGKHVGAEKAGQLFADVIEESPIKDSQKREIFEKVFKYNYYEDDDE